ncbi:MAG: alcohol dehydrogenase catalytic domain-containing protein [bacterium]|nr:alcohol dehydrogenase catalytic domain-containing protein [Candidatus Sumerlaeota bacterium]
MIAATISSDCDFRVEDVSVPGIADNEILLKVRAASICGTDTKIINNGHGKLAPGRKIILGHEFVGVIEQCGRDIDCFKVGQRVGVAPNIGCGQCEECIRGLANMCPHYSAFGIDMDGGHTEFVRIPSAAIMQGNVVELPEHVSFEEAALAEPFSCVLNGQRGLRIEAGDTVLVCGAGPIGIMHIMLAGVSGAANIIAADINDARLEMARMAGANITCNSMKGNLRDVVMSHTKNRGANAIITACPVPEAQEQSLEMAAPYGRICFFGGLKKDSPFIRINSNLIHYRNLVITGSTGGSPHDYRRALALIASGRISPRAVISQTYDISQIADAYKAAQNPSNLKIVLCNN